MFKIRFRYFTAFILVIILGLLSRRIEFIPQWVGDTLWALMIYLMVKFIFINATGRKVALISILFCFAIEFSQLYQAPWINEIRQTLPGRLILGQGFLWSDLLAYSAGIMLGVLYDRRK